MAVLVWLPITDCAVLVVINPAGPLHTVVTITGTSIASLNSTVQVKVTLTVSIGRMGLVGTLVMLTDMGAGTVWCILRHSAMPSYECDDYYS